MELFVQSCKDVRKPLLGQVVLERSMLHRRPNWKRGNAIGVGDLKLFLKCSDVGTSMHKTWTIDQDEFEQLMASLGGISRALEAIAVVGQCCRQWMKSVLNSTELLKNCMARSRLRNTSSIEG